MSVIRTIIIILLLSVGCGEEKEIDETDIMNTVCIDGFKNLSIFDGYQCYYHPVTIRGRKVECK